MNKTTRNLLIIFAVLVALYFLFFRSKDKVSTEKIDEKLFVADSSKIDKIEITKINESLTLEKINGVWMITKPVNYQADTASIQPMLSNLKNFKIESETSKNPGNFSKYLDSANNANIKVSQEGKELGSFLLGKSATSPENTYLQKTGENRILLASNLNAANFTKTLKDYRYKLIFSIPSYYLNKVYFKSTDSNKADFSVAKDSAGKWFIGADSVQSTIMENFLNLMNNFNTEDFYDSTMTTFPQPEWTVSLGGTQPRTINLYKHNTDYIVQVSGINQLFKMSEGYVGQLKKKRADFIPPPPKK